MQSPWPYKVFLACVFGVFYSIFYVYPNLHPAFQPSFLPVTALDRATPFLPWTFLIYTSDYFLITSLLFLLKDRASFHRFVRRMLELLILSGLVFYAFPTQILRPEYPTWTAGTMIGFITSHVWSIDAPTNCFPSLHVGFTGLAFWSIREKARGKKGLLVPLYAAWTLAIFVSVLTTKQHYFFDIFGGLALNAIVIALDRTIASHRTTKTWIKNWESTAWWSYPHNKPSASKRKKAA